MTYLLSFFNTIFLSIFGVELLLPPSELLTSLQSIVVSSDAPLSSLASSLVVNFDLLASLIVWGLLFYAAIALFCVAPYRFIKYCVRRKK